MTILGIETSCDETGAAIVTLDQHSKKLTVLKNELATSLILHAQTGGIIPESAAREQLKLIIPVIKNVLKEIDREKIDAIAVTNGPGLIGSLLVGVETARTLAYIWQKPIIPVNHLYGHIYANLLNNDGIKEIVFPSIALVVSGGHTDLILLKSHSDVLVVGSTRDDACGEAFDKIGRLLGLAYPAGPVISKLAEKGDPKAYDFPRPMIGSKDFDFSFSGLKTSVLYETKKMEQITEQNIADICASVEQAIIDILVRKTLQAVKKYNVKSILVGGGVSANKKLRNTLKTKTEELNKAITLSFPEQEFCIDNAAMIAAAAFYRNKTVDWREIKADPQLYY